MTIESYSTKRTFQRHSVACSFSWGEMIKLLFIVQGRNSLECNHLRYLAARNFMLSGTALLRGMTYSCCEELGTFKPSFHHQH